MNKRYLLLGFLTFITLNSQVIFSQLKVGAKIGYSLGKLTETTDNIYSQDFSSVSGMDFGAVLEIPVSGLFSVQPEISYTHRGGVRNGMQPVPLAPLLKGLEGYGVSLEMLNQLVMGMGGEPLSDTTPLYADYNNTNSLQYVEIPVLAKFGWGDTWRFFAQAGPSVSFLVKATQTTSGSSNLYVDVQGNKLPLTLVPEQDLKAETDVKDDLNTFNFGIQGGIGVTRKIDSKNEIYFDSRVSYGLTPLQKDETFGKSKVGGIIFSLGYNFSL